MRWLAFGAVAWLAVLALFAAVLQWRPNARATPADTAATAVTRALRNAAPTHAAGRMPAWTVVKATSAHHVMVVEVEAQRPEQARQIAVQIVEPVRSRYEEILVYVSTPGSSGELPARRVQWTPRGGYVETVFTRN